MPLHIPPKRVWKDIRATAACFGPCNRRFERLQGRFPVLQTHYPCVRSPHLRARYRFARANRLCSCAVFLLRPR